MSNKKLFFLIALLILNIFVISLANTQAQLPEEDLPPEVEKIQNVSEKGKETVEKLTDKEKREYLFKEWQKILKENKVVAKLDGFFTKYSIVFRILFGQPYSLSLTLAFVIILWLFIALGIADLTKKGLGFLEGFAYILGIVAAVVLAQIQILRRIVSFLIKLIFYPESAWVRFIVFVVIVGIIVLLYYFEAGIGQYLKELRKKRKEEETEQKQKEIKKFTENLEKGAGI